MPDEPKFTEIIFKITQTLTLTIVRAWLSVRYVRVSYTKYAVFACAARQDNAFSSPTQFMAQRKTTVDEAWAGDIIGFADNGTFKIGDTLTEGEQLHFKGIAQFFA